MKKIRFWVDQKGDVAQTEEASGGVYFVTITHRNKIVSIPLLFISVLGFSQTMKSLRYEELR